MVPRNKPQQPIWGKQQQHRVTFCFLHCVYCPLLAMLLTTISHPPNWHSITSNKSLMCHEDGNGLTVSCAVERMRHLHSCAHRTWKCETSLLSVTIIAYEFCEMKRKLSTCHDSWRSLEVNCHQHGIRLMRQKKSTSQTSKMSKSCLHFLLS